MEREETSGWGENTEPMGLRAFIALPVLLAVLTFASAAGAMGSPNVAALQVTLWNRGLYHATIDGVKGPLTTAAAPLPAPQGTGARRDRGPENASGARTVRSLPSRRPSALRRHVGLGRRRPPIPPRLARLSLRSVRRQVRNPNRRSPVPVSALAPDRRRWSRRPGHDPHAFRACPALSPSVLVADPSVRRKPLRAEG